MSQDYTGCYGLKSKPSEVKKWLLGCVEENLTRHEEERWAAMIWGNSGQGKTSIVKQMAQCPVKFRGKEYEGFEVIDVPIAQAEELGDLTGLPESEIEMIKDDIKKFFIKEDSIISVLIKDGWMPTGRTRTRCAPPEWVPTEERPGIILFDDANRAGLRIMKGIMQLLQNYKMTAWKIPAGWTIVMTGNPDNRAYSVTSQDSAMLTRLKHITFESDIKEWAQWAENEKLDPRGISFLLRYPEMMFGSELTNPRTLSEFFRVLRRYPNVEGSNKTLVFRDARSLLDEMTVATMMTFFQKELQFCITPEEILSDTNAASKELERLMNVKEPRIDILNVINSRLVAYFGSNHYVFNKSHVEPFQKWVLDKNHPRDMSYALCRSISLTETKHRRMLLTGREILEMIMENSTYTEKEDVLDILSKKECVSKKR